MKALQFAFACPNCGHNGENLALRSVDHRADRADYAALRTGADIECHHCGITTHIYVTATPDHQRFPIGPLLELNLPPSRECARIAGVTLRTWERYKADGLIPLAAADRLSTALGWHLENVWPTAERELAEAHR